MFVCCECRVLSSRGLGDGLITRPGESYRLWRVVVCDEETSQARRLKPATGLWKIQPQGCNARKTTTTTTTYDTQLVHLLVYNTQWIKTYVHIFLCFMTNLVEYSIYTFAFCYFIICLNFAIINT